MGLARYHRQSHVKALYGSDVVEVLVSRDGVTLLFVMFVPLVMMMKNDGDQIVELTHAAVHQVAENY